MWSRVERALGLVTVLPHTSPPSLILPSLYLGAVASYNAFDVRGWAQRVNITHVVDIGGATYSLWARLPAIYVHKISVQDDTSQDLSGHLTEAVQFIAEARDSRDSVVFVHCAMGASRSASIVLAYIVQEVFRTFE